MLIVRSALQHGYGAIKLKFAGGEASLNFALVWELHEYAVAAAATYGLALEAVVLSNGVGVSRAGLIELQRRGIRLMISLDGFAADHDTQRVFANGHGSFAAVARTIERAQADRPATGYLRDCLGPNGGRVSPAWSAGCWIAICRSI